MPNSFSRFLSDEELQRVRAIYEESLTSSPVHERAAQRDACEPEAEGVAKESPLNDSVD